MHERQRQEFLGAAEEMFDRLHAWRAQHPEASFDEIAAEVTPLRRQLMGLLLCCLATQHGDGRYATLLCPTCHMPMKSSGLRKRQVVHPEGDVLLKRSYHYCPFCASGLFSLDQQLKITNLRLTPATIDAVLTVRDLIDSYRLAAEQFTALTHVYVSKSSLQRIANSLDGESIA